ncbi:MAG TPA: discoidin domain-containing protein [Bacillota bacterium]|nr:discoidin domain-containing protein [Bacillota bacterium]HOK69390.1 discoidin domain-containing protein [Bacillota bacterium]HPP85726.1 discoidin domain-containing protein [Bacillota bacterium]
MKKKIIAVIVAALMIIPLCGVLSSAAETNIAQGKSYTYTGKYVDGSGKVLYPDATGKELTDGIMGSTKDDCSYLKDHWVGLNWKGENTECNSQTWNKDTTISINYITVDLASVQSSLTKFVLYATQFADGVDKPKSVEVFVSSNGTDYTSVGTATETKFVDAEVAGKPEYGIYAYTVTAATAASARYVKFKVTHGGAWTHVSEVEVYQSDAPATSSSTSSVPTVKVPKETYSLITTDVSKWQTYQITVNDITEDAVVTTEGDAVVISGSQQLWPFAYYDIPEADQHKVKISDFKLVYKFKVEDGKANIILFCEGSKCLDNTNYISDLTHIIVPDGEPGRAIGADDLQDGIYEGSIDLSALSLSAGSLKEEGYITISSVKVFTVGGGKVTIEKFALESYETVDVPGDPGSSSSTSSASSQTSSTSSAPTSTSSSAASGSSSGGTKVGDAGVAGMIILFAASLAGMTFVSLKKRRVK